MSNNTAVVHTTACGAVPYDHTWGVGAAKSQYGYSPSKRINDLRQLYMQTPESLSSQWAVVMTETYKKYESLTPFQKKARSMAKFMEVCDLRYKEGELLLVDAGVEPYASNVHVEYSNDWIYDELRNRPMYERKFNAQMYDDKTRDEILSTEAYWAGRDVSSVFVARMLDEIAKGVNMAGGMLLTNPTIMAQAAPGHLTMNYEYALKRGLKGIKEDIRTAMAELDNLASLDHIKALQFHEAQLILFEGISNYFRRYAAFAKEQMDKYSSQQTKDELKRLSEICEKVSEEPPEDFWEAMQLVMGLFEIQYIEGNPNAVSLGRMDQYMYPYYKASLDKGVSKEFMEEIIQYSYLQMSVIGTIHPATPDDFFAGGVKGGTGGTALIVGGVDKDGNDVTNDLSFMFLDAMAHTRMLFPWLTVRYHKNTPYELKVKTVELMRIGTGHPKILNDNVCIDAMMRLGVPLEDARDYPFAMGTTLSNLAFVAVMEQDYQDATEQFRAAKDFFEAAESHDMAQECEKMLSALAGRA